MRRMPVNLSWIVIGAAAIALASAAEARAAEEVTARVPFAFSVGAASLPAGSYVVREAIDDPALLEIVNTHGSEAAIAITIPADAVPGQTAAQPGLVFVKRGGEYFLKRLVTDDGSDREFILPRAQDEREIVSGGH